MGYETRAELDVNINSKVHESASYEIHQETD